MKLKKWTIRACAALVAIGVGVGLGDTIYTMSSAHAEVVMVTAPMPAEGGIATSPAPDPEIDTAGFLTWTFQAVRQRDGWMVASAMSVFLTFLLRVGVRRRTTSWLRWLGTSDLGGIVAVTAVSALSGFAHATAAGERPGSDFLLLLLQVVIGAIGMYVPLKKTLKATR